MIKSRIELQPVIMIVVTTLLLFWLSWLSISTLTFFTSDTGLRLTQIQSLIEHQWRTFAIDYPARFVDSELQHVPYYDAYLVIDDQLYLPVSPFFPLIVSWLYALVGGIIALPLVPALGGVLTGLMVYRLARLSGLPHSHFAFWGTIFATPLFFYSLTLWDHTLGTALALGGTYGMAKGLTERRWRPVFWGGLVIGFGLGQRPELYIFAIAIGLSLFVVSRFDWRVTTAAGVGGFAGVLPVWILQYFWFGHPLAPSIALNLFGYGRPDLWAYNRGEVAPLFMRKALLLIYTVPRDLVTFLATLLVIFGLTFIVFTLRQRRWRKPRFLVGALGILGLGYLIYLFICWKHIIPGLLPTFPLLALAVIYINHREDTQSVQVIVYRFVFFTALFFGGVMLLFWPAFGGYQWGTRYLLPLYPLVVYLALHVYTFYQQTWRGQMQRIFQIGAMGLLGLSLLFQILGARLLYMAHYEHIPVLKTLQVAPVEIVLTNKPYFPSQMAASGKTFIYVEDEGDLEMMLERLRERGIEAVGIVSLKGSPFIPPDPVDEFEIQELIP
jgi:hypothetical protein